MSPPAEEYQDGGEQRKQFDFMTEGNRKELRGSLVGAV